MNKEYDNVGTPFCRTIEECSELQHAICKAVRFGLFHRHGDNRSNYDEIKLEMEDVRRQIDKLDAWMSEQLRMHYLTELEPSVAHDTKITIAE